MATTVAYCAQLLELHELKRERWTGHARYREEQTTRYPQFQGHDASHGSPKSTVIMLFSTLILALGTTLVTSAAVPASPSISSVTHSGNGCPQDTAVDVVDGGRQFRLHGFASRAPGVDTTQNCALHFTVGGAPDGWQVSLKHVTVRAWGYFPAGSGLKYYLTGFWSADAEKMVSCSVGDVSGLMVYANWCVDLC